MKDFKIALQLYSVRDHMEKDMDATLKAVKEMGYDYVEFAGYFDKTGSYDATAGGSNWTGDLGDYDVIWYPIMGYRGYDIGVHSQVNIDGPYWTSTPNTNTTESYRLYQDIYNGKGYFTVGKAKGRSYAYPVRCMKIQ